MKEPMIFWRPALAVALVIGLGTGLWHFYAWMGPVFSLCVIPVALFIAWRIDCHNNKASRDQPQRPPTPPRP